MIARQAIFLKRKLLIFVPTYLWKWRYCTLYYAWKVKVKVAHLCPALCDQMDCSLPGFSVHWISQARILEWVAILFSRGSFQPRDWTQVLLHHRQIFHHLSHKKKYRYKLDAEVDTWTASIISTWLLIFWSIRTASLFSFIAKVNVEIRVQISVLNILHIW